MKNPIEKKVSRLQNHHNVKNVHKNRFYYLFLVLRISMTHLCSDFGIWVLSLEISNDKEIESFKFVEKKNVSVCLEKILNVVSITSKLELYQVLIFFPPLKKRRSIYREFYKRKVVYDRFQLNNRFRKPF
jgi:hypothetical protein